MHKPAKDKHFIKQPWYEGGPKAMKQYIAEQLCYPDEALAQRVEGTVSVRFDIDHKGDVIDVKIIGHGLGHGCDEEAIRLVKSRWTRPVGCGSSITRRYRYISGCRRRRLLRKQSYR
jgi:TonB family protein